MSQQLTQPVSYTQDTSAEVKKSPQPPLIAFVEDCHDAANKIEIRQSTITIGRSSHCDIVVPNHSVSRLHCSLAFMELDGTCYLSTSSDCWLWQAQSWNLAAKGNQAVPLLHRQRLRLLPPSKSLRTDPGIEYTLHLTAKPTFDVIRAGSHSFDIEYLKLLRYIEHVGEWKNNKKGPNCTLPQCHVLNIDLRDANNRNLLPMTSLRSLYGGRGALIEALWYLRGEDDISFLQKHKCHFWDRQAIKRGDVDWVGWNYGLLTHFPQTNGQNAVNQLEQRVIRKLCQHGSSSRNMICSLDKPGEETVQGACTSSIHFSVSICGEEEALDLTVNQRSSDVMVGLPHDVVVWSIVLHLVRREVKIRSQRNLVAGKLSFVIGQNAAHVYDINRDAMNKVLERKPFEHCQPHLLVDEMTGNSSIFELAQNYQPAMFRICDYAKGVHHPAIKMEQAVE